jgi:hypothetical protein
MSNGLSLLPFELCLLDNIPLLPRFSETVDLPKVLMVDGHCTTPPLDLDLLPTLLEILASVVMDSSLPRVKLAMMVTFYLATAALLLAPLNPNGAVLLLPPIFLFALSAEMEFVIPLNNAIPEDTITTPFLILAELTARPPAAVTVLLMEEKSAMVVLIVLPPANSTRDHTSGDLLTARATPADPEICNPPSVSQLHAPAVDF